MPCFVVGIEKLYTLYIERKKCLLCNFSKLITLIWTVSKYLKIRGSNHFYSPDVVWNKTNNICHFYTWGLPQRLTLAKENLS